MSALVTGSARRNGKALALYLARCGVRVAVHYRSSKSDAEETLAECNAHTPGCCLVKGDLTKPADAARAVYSALSELGSLEVLVNNVGNYLRKDLFDLTPREWRDQLESNLYATYYCTSNAMVHMRKRKFGRVINLGYAANERPTFNRLTVPYHIAKTGIGIFTRRFHGCGGCDAVRERHAMPRCVVLRHG